MKQDTNQGNESSIVNQIENDYKKEHDSEIEDEDEEIFSDYYEEVGTECKEDNLTVTDINIEIQQENANISLDMETLQEVLESESNTQIHKYFNMNLFKDIIAGNLLKTKRSSDSDLHGPTKKKNL